MHLAVALLAAALANASFEDAGAQVPGWTISMGARSADRGATSVVTVDPAEARDGAASLRLAGGPETAAWWMVGQDAEVRPGRRVVFRVAARCRGVRREANQYENANAALAFFDAQGNRLALTTSPVLSGDRAWVDLHVQALAPPGSARVHAFLLLSMSGTVWFDDARLEIASSDTATETGRAAAFAALRLHLERTYPFFGLPGKPAPDDLQGDAGREDFAGELRTVLARLDDIHVWFDAPGGRVYPGPRNPHPPNWNRKAARARIEKTVEEGPVLAGRIGDVGYLALDRLVPDDAPGVESALEALADARALVLDLRANRGGDERVAWRIAGRFLDRPHVYALAQVRDPTLAGLDGFRLPVERIVRPSGQGADTRPVAVLQGPYTVSSAEALLLMLRPLERVTTVGLPSRGASGNPQPFALTPECTVWVPTWRSLTPEGSPIEGVGVPPEIVVEAGPEAWRDGDPVLERALELLR